MAQAKLKSTLRKIAIVGPLPPIKSGIARHTSALTEALLADSANEVRVWGFKRQYPGWLYPGGDERDASLSSPTFRYEETVDGVNPASWFHTAHAIQKFTPDILVSPAWTFTTAPALGYIAKKARQHGARSYVVVHNVADHEQASWKSMLSRCQLSNADKFITHSQALAKSLSELQPGTPSVFSPHPVFDTLPQPEGRLTREQNIELLFFGIIRPYKGLDLLLKAIAKSGRRDLRLTIAGQFWQNEKDTTELIDRLGISDLVELRSRFIDDREAAALFQRADAVVLPYRSVTGSGVVATAFHYGRAVIATRLPGFAEIVKDGETGWLFSPNSIDELADHIWGMTRAQTDPAGIAAKQFGQRFTWEKFASLVVA
ncbi:glycosyltransferase [Cognatishimia maritima]|uniref:glycosyltransferase n=1 Tax=Cognatishimia maritima TaxID=870908 RepID=UPI001F61CB7B|nr:glycosyltransferase [Cognatishimia maritima]